MAISAPDCVFLREVLANDNYRFRMALKPGKREDFFTAGNPEVLALREKLLKSEPGKYSALEPGNELLMRDAVEYSRLSLAGTPGEVLIQLGTSWEEDFLLLDRELVLKAGCVCFPSSWALEEKIGKPMFAVHQPVPALNEELGASISQFLERLKPGAFWTRSNWGLSRSEQLNQHPSLNLPRLDVAVGAEEIWLRVEHQALVRMGQSGGILFLIKVLNYRFSEVIQESDLANRLRLALETMPQEIARYKGIADARKRLVALTSPT